MLLVQMWVSYQATELKGSRVRVEIRVGVRVLLCLCQTLMKERVVDELNN